MLYQKTIRLNSTYYFIVKIPNKRELQKIAFNHSSDIDFRDFINYCKKYTAKPYSFLVIDATLASHNPLRFRKNLLEWLEKLIITTDDKVRDEKLKYDINRETAKTSESSGKIDKNEYLTGGEILPSNQRQIEEQAKFSYFPLEKRMKKKKKNCLLDALKSLNLSDKQMN